MLEITRASMDQDKVYPGFWHAALLCAIFVGVQVAFMMPVGVLDVVFKLHLGSHPAVLGATNLAACAVVMVVGWRIGNPPMREVFVLRRVSALALMAVIIASAGAIIVLSEVDNLVRKILPMPEFIARILGDLMSPSEHFLATLFLMVIVAPVTEEVMFRGLILRGFLRRFSLLRAFLLSALLFGLIHLNPWQFFSAAGLGLMFAWWYARAQSLIPSLLGHALVNAMFATSQLLPFKIRGFNESLASMGFQPLWFDTVGVVLLAAGLWLFGWATPPIKAFVAMSSNQVPPPIPPTAGVPPVIPPAGTG